MDWEFDSEPSDKETSRKKDVISESRVLDLVDRIAKDATTSAQLEPSAVMRKLERDLGQSLLSFRSAIFDHLNKKRAQLSPTPKKAVRVENVKEKEEEEEEEEEEDAPKQSILKKRGKGSKPSLADEIELEDGEDEEDEEEEDDDDEREEEEEDEEEDDDDDDDDDEYEDEEEGKKSRSTTVIKKQDKKSAKASSSKGPSVVAPISLPPPIASSANAPAAESAASPGVAKKKGKVKLASSMPLTLPRTLKRGRTMLVQIEDPHFDLSGDIGAIGRLTAIEGRRGSLRNSGIVLDLKGHQFSGTIIPSASFLVVGFGGKEAKVESIVSDFVQCEHLANLVDGLSGSLVSGSEAALLKFDDVDAPEGPRLMQVLGDRKGGDTDDDGRTAGGSEAVGSDESSIGFGGYDAANSDGEGKPSKPKKKKKTKTKGMGVSERKMIGSKVSMKKGGKGKPKKGKKK